MITKVKVRHFKRFKKEEFDLSNHVILAGPNNSGKTTLLQAITVWRLSLQRWLDERGPDSGSKAKQRAGVSITRKDFTALPLREMNLLWTDTLVSLKKEDAKETGRKPGFPRAMEITLEGNKGQNPWDMTLEYRYGNSELIHVKPSEKHIGNLPDEARQIDVIHVPPFSGIGAEETHYDQPYQNLLIGQGKAGDILRNLLHEVYEKSPDKDWGELCQHIKDIFGYTLLPPEYEGRPYIRCEYLCGVPRGKGRNGLTKLDIASAGSGFHQVLLLLAFFYARPSTILLLDEPDAHLHVVLQKQIYDMLRSIAAKQSCQLIIATHSEVLIDNTSPSSIISFFKKPHRLVSEIDRDQIREALKRLTATDMLQAEQSEGILYVESQTDFNLLHAWATILDHPLKNWFNKSPFWHSNQGRNPQEAKGHFFALNSLKKDIKGFLLLDGDNRNLKDREVGSEGLIVKRWGRYESENYLVHPKALMRFVKSRLEPLFAQPAEAYLKDQLPPAVYRDPIKPHDYHNATPASKTLLPEFFRSVNLDITKQEYYLIAEQMEKSEIPDEVEETLNDIAKTFKIR